MLKLYAHPSSEPPVGMLPDFHNLNRSKIYHSELDYRNFLSPGERADSRRNRGLCTVPSAGRARWGPKSAWHPAQHGKDARSAYGLANPAHFLSSSKLHKGLVFPWIHVRVLILLLKANHPAFLSACSGQQHVWEFLRSS